ncbi:CBS domain-containing protein [Thermodesulfobacterium sp. TA1]|uniref:CBS domain-containing protein n=1 Tax=Thermodesulfobacterium sp. TA1 TaxID=2234087 RepID=UPI001232CE43|nr:CBS domain-containing protein [Thermodesulfobacterium sp. TA1]QER42624.1 CBS domain-containing protein [Thermodesulfobacterium sp. TA1]
MSDGKLVKDVMLGIFEYPHIPYWFSIEQTIKVVKASFIQTKKYTEPLTVLVFDEKYNLLGTVTLKDILKGIEPLFLKAPAKAQVPEEEKTGLAIVWDSLFNQESKKLAKKPVSEIMVPVKHFVGPEDPITKAAYLMIHYDLPVLPVIEEKKKFVGIVRMIEVFDAISEEIIKE